MNVQHKRKIKETPRNLSQGARRSAKYRNPNGPSKYFASYRTRKIVDENLDDLEVPSMELQSQLCPLLWNSDKLDPKVRTSLMKVVKKFVEFLGVRISVKDVILTGSMANYNWNNKSDIDVHVLVDHKDIDADESISSEFFSAKKTIWNSQYSIRMKGHDVEMYVQDMAADLFAQGVYSITRDLWLKKPQQVHVELDVDTAKIKAASIIDMIDTIDKIKDDEKKIRRIERIKDRIKQMRSAGLSTEAGEFSPENLAFKILRNSGYIGKLMKVKTKAFNDYFSLNESATVLYEAKSPRYDYGCLMAFFTIPLWTKLLSIVDKEDIYEGEGGFGLEDSPHVTVLFGFHDEKVDPKRLKADVDAAMNEQALVFKLGKASLFDNPEYDVLKFDIEDSNGMLFMLNEAMRKKYEHTNTYPDYHPHATIAYIKKGEGQKYADMINEAGLQYDVIADRMVYSKPPKPTKYFWKLNKDSNYLEIGPGLDMPEEKLEIIKDFICFVRQKLDIQERVYVSLRNGRDDTIRTTAAYSPMEDKNSIRCNGRALVDILRSIAHEMVHNKQREAGKFKLDQKIQNIGGVIEGEADAKAGRLIKDFTHNHGYDRVYDY